jgi:hypothetical protein
MPEDRTIERARKDAQEGKSPSTQAGEFVREEIEHVREGKHGARSAKQAIAIGLSKARRAGVKLPPVEGSSEMARKTARDYRRGQTSPSQKPSRTRSRATHAALEREGSESASETPLSRQGHRAARSRGSQDMKTAAKKAARTKGPEGRRQAALKAARTRQRER